MLVSVSVGGNLIRHDRVHTDEKPISWRLCDQICSRREKDLQKHVLSVHERKTPFWSCIICNKRFLEKTEMKKHVESIHEEKNKHRCNICTKGFAEKAKMIGHIASFHEGKKSHLCATCDASFDYSVSLKKHIAAIHDGQ